MTPQAFSYPTLYKNKIYIPPYGLTKVIDYMIVMDLKSYTFEKISIDVDASTEKWQKGIVVNDKIYFLPYNESKVLIVDTDTQEVSYILTKEGKGKWLFPHHYQNKIIALPYGENTTFDDAIIINIDTNNISYKTIEVDINCEKKWHTTQLVDNKIIGAPRGENLDVYFPYAIEFNCDTLDYKLTNLSHFWKDYDLEKMTNKKFTTLARCGDTLYAPPYSENANFDILLTYKNGAWSAERTGIQSDSRKYYSHTVAKNNKIYFPPAGHEEDWSLLLVIDGETGKWYTKDLGIGKESKKYFTGVENSKGKIYYMPRGGCACMPQEIWKQFGDLVEVLVINTKDDTYYTIDVSEFFTDNTSIEKYNQCVIENDVIYAFPYGESDTFQTLLIFDTIKEEVVTTIDLNEI